MRYLLIPIGDTAPGDVARVLEAGGVTDGERNALSRTFTRMILTSELLGTYAVGVAGKPSKQ